MEGGGVVAGWPYIMGSGKGPRARKEQREGIDAHSKGMDGDFPLEGGASVSQESNRSFSHRSNFISERASSPFLPPPFHNEIIGWL